MKNIKFKILSGFLSVAICTGVIVGLLISWKLSQAVARQSKILVEDAISHEKAIIVRHNGLLADLLENLYNLVEEATNRVASNPVVAKNIESQQLVPLTNLIARSIANSESDFGLVFDAEGKVQAFYPPNANAARCEDYFINHPTHIARTTKQIADGKLPAEKAKLSLVSKGDAALLEMIGMQGKAPSHPGGIIMTSSAPILDDFGDLIGIYISGKLLTNYTKPLEQINQMLGSACVVYMEEMPLAQAGFQSAGDFNIASLALSKAELNTVYRSDRPTNLRLEFNHQVFHAVCSAIKSYTGDNIGVLCTAFPESRTSAIKKNLLAHSAATKRNLYGWFLGIGIVSLICFAALSLLVSSGIVRSISPVIKGLMKISNQVLMASQQLAGASNDMVDGSSKQAASIEETSASLEEMSATTRQNADNARQTDTFMQGVHQEVISANKAMDHLTASMQDISQAGQETSKIIMTIDEIAFQTNLLALNAAVEAARAGEAGSGFAVVADEVRNLARRSADAAKHTSALIEKTIKKVGEGAEIVASTSGAFQAVTKGTSQIEELVSDITVASKEQAQGILQINSTVSGIDAVVQQNSASAEQLSSASEELTAQAEEMATFVNDLAMLVGDKTLKKMEKPTHGVMRNPESPTTEIPLELLARQIADAGSD